MGKRDPGTEAGAPAQTETKTGAAVPDDSSKLAAVKVYSDFLNAQLAEQSTRKTSFEQRGLSVVTTSGALATLLFGVGAFAKTEKPYVLSHQAQGWLIGALIAFVIAGVLALLTNLPIAYEVPKLESILSLARKQPPHSETEARLEIAEAYKRMATDAKRKNGAKGWLLFAALVCEVGAILSVAVAVGYVIS